MHIFEIKIMKKNDIKKIDFRVQNPLNIIILGDICGVSESKYRLIVKRLCSW